MVDDSRIKLFESVAKSQGFSPEEIAPFLEFGKIRQAEKAQEDEDELFDPATDVVFQRNKALRELSGDESFDLSTDPVNLRAGATAERKRNQREIDAENELENFEQFGGDSADLSEDAKSFARSRGIDIPKELTDDEKEDKESRKSITRSAQNVLDILDMIDSGQLSGEDADIALEFVSSKFAESAFDVGGKNLTAIELAVLQGSRPTIQIKGPNVIEKLRGIQPPQTAKVLDSNEELRAKMTLAINAIKQEQDGTPLLPGPGGEQNQSLAVTPSPDGPGGPELFPSIPQQKSFAEKVGQGAFSLIVAPAIRGVKGYAELLGTAAGVVALPTISKISPQAGADLAEALAPIVERKYSSPGQTIVTGGLQTLGGVGVAFDIATLGAGTAGKQSLKIAGKQVLKLGARNMAFNLPLYGTGEATKALREGKSEEQVVDAFFNGMTGQSFTGPFEGVFGESDLTKTADTVAAIFGPIVGARMIQKFNTSQAFRPVGIESLNKKVQSSFVGRIGENIRGKTATGLLSSVDAKNKQSVTKLENTVETIIKNTRSKTSRGIAKELPTLKADAGNYINTRLSQVDDTIQPISTLDVKNKIMSAANESTSGQANPKQLAQFEDALDALIRGKNKGATPLTMSYTDINRVRKDLNKGIKSTWFSNGQPLTSTTENLMSLKWTGSSVLSDIVNSTDGLEDVGKAVRLQHFAISGEPLFSKSVLAPKTGSRGGPVGAFTNFTLNIFDAIMDPIKIGGIRKFTQKEQLLPQTPQVPQAPPTQGLPPAPPQLGQGGGGNTNVSNSGLPEEIENLFLLK